MLDAWFVFLQTGLQVAGVRSLARGHAGEYQPNG